MHLKGLDSPFKGTKQKDMRTGVQIDAQKIILTDVQNDGRNGVRTDIVTDIQRIAYTD